ncbi:MAG: hypothetical protein AAFZ07_03280 [Actinomycetota bacterium]
MRSRVGALTILGAVLLVGGTLARPAGAGGWAVTTLDDVPSAEPGVPVEVGFTIRQHGVSPVDVEDVAIEVIGPDGTSEIFPAQSAELQGHYVSTVTFPDAGEFEWVVHQGWFSTQDLGTIAVGTTVAEQYRFGSVLRYGLLVVVGGAAVWLLADLVAFRRRALAPA